MALGGPNIYPSSGTWLGISRELTPSTATGIWQLLPFDMPKPVCDYERIDDSHDQPIVVIAFGRLKDMKIITRTLCFDCYTFIMKAGTVGEPMYGNTQPFRWDEIEVRNL